MDVAHIARLANLPLSSSQQAKFQTQFASTLKTIQLIDELDTTKVSPTSQVTGLTNVTRPDQLTPQTTLSAKEALSNAPRKYQDYFVVPAIFNE